MQWKLGSHFRMFQIETQELGSVTLYRLVIAYGSPTPTPGRNISLDKAAPSSQGQFPVRVKMIRKKKKSPLFPVVETKVSCP